MTQQVAHLCQRDVALDKSRGILVPQIVQCRLMCWKVSWHSRVRCFQPPCFRQRGVTWCARRTVNTHDLRKILIGSPAPSLKTRASVGFGSPDASRRSQFKTASSHYFVRLSPV